MSKNDNEENINNVLDYNKKINLYCILRNILSLICFTILAIIFKKWWIVLFAIIFTSYVGKEEKDE